MALILQGVGYTYASGMAFAQEALSGVDLVLSPGRLTLVLGPTGSGKSTLLRIAAGLIAPGTGAVTLDGAAVRSSEARSAGGVGLVFQSPESQLFADTVLDDVAFGPRNQGLDSRSALNVASSALVSVGLDPDTFGGRSPFTLSGGEARRAALAGVLAMRPSYLLLDEPTSGLDAAGRTSVMQAIEAIRSTTALAIVTHDAEEFLTSAESVLILDGGRPAFSGPTASLVADPAPLARAGLRAPDVLRAQLLARDAGAILPELTLDPVRCADALYAAAPGEAGS